MQIIVQRIHSNRVKSPRPSRVYYLISHLTHGVFAVRQLVYFLCTRTNSCSIRAAEVTCISGTLVKLYYLSSSKQDKIADKMGFAEMFPTHMVRIHQIISVKHSFIQCKFFLIDFIDLTARFRLQDFEGQGRAERISRYIITLFGVVGLIWGAFIQQFSQTVYILVAGVLLTLIVSIMFIVFLLLQRLSLSFNFG